MWDAASGSKNQSTIICVHQPAGYTFSLAKTLGSDAAQLLPTNSTYGTLDTRTPQVLLTIGITCSGIYLTSLLYGAAVLLVTSTPPLFVLGVGYLASDAAVIVLTISSAKITSIADKMVGLRTSVPGPRFMLGWDGPSMCLPGWPRALCGLLWGLVLRGLLRSPKNWKSRNQDVSQNRGGIESTGEYIEGWECRRNQLYFHNLFLLHLLYVMLQVIVYQVVVL
jgi:hypothetical protein